MLPTKFQFIWESSFRREDFLEINQSETRMACGGHFFNGSRRNEPSLQRTFHKCFLLSFGSFGQAVSEEKIFKNRPIRKNNCLWRPCLLMDRAKMCNLQRETSIDASYQVSVHLAQGFQRRIIKSEKLTDDGRRTPSDDNIKCHKILYVSSAHNRH